MEEVCTGDQTTSSIIPPNEFSNGSVRILQFTLSTKIVYRFSKVLILIE